MAPRTSLCVAAAVVWAGVSGCTDEGPAATACRVSFEPVVTIGAEAGVSGPAEWSTVVRAHGLLFVAPTYEPGKVSVFDADGRLLRTIGAQGEGPRELLDASSVAVTGDTLWIHDRQHARISRFLVSGEFVGTVALDSHDTRFVPVEGGGYVLMRGLAYKDPGPVTVDVMAGDRLRSRFSISNESTEASDDSGERNGTILRDHGGDAIWVGYIGRYLFEAYAYDGTRLSRITRTLSWFPPSSEWSTRGEDIDTIGAVLDLETDDRGRLMVLLGRASTREFRASSSTPVEAEADLHPEVDIRSGEVILQMLDPATRNVIGEWTGSEPWLKGFADREHVFSRTTTDDGVPIVQVFRIVIVDPRTGGPC